jgi:hypothetical protein
MVVCKNLFLIQDMINKYTSIIVTCLIVAGIGLVDASERMEPPETSDALNRLIELAGEQRAQHDGERYWWQVFRILDKISDDQFLTCLPNKSDPATMYRYVLEIGADGALKKVHWNKSDEFTLCIDKVFIRIKLPAPPKSPFYLYLSEN